MDARGRGTRTLLLALAVGLIGLGAPSSAGAAAQIGTTFPGPNLSCGAATVVQSTSPGGSYAAPSAGVITSWSFHAGTTAPTLLKFKMARPAGVNTFTIVGESPPKTPAAGVLNTYTDVRIPVLAGDVIGYYTEVGPSFTGCGKADAGFAFHDHDGDVAPGTTDSYGPSSPSFQLDFSAVLEPDADNDGFGDESQDNCPTIANPNQADNDADGIGNVCDSTPDGEPDATAPNATITRGPKDKTKKKSATFEFTGTDARAVASFQCRLDGGAFATCTSPHTVKVKKGKHTFEVRAVDQAGNVGAPASDTWKRKKRRK
jgi:hypothetical protein